MGVFGKREKRGRQGWIGLLECIFAQDNHNPVGGVPYFASRKSNDADLS